MKISALVKDDGKKLMEFPTLTGFQIKGFGRNVFCNPQFYFCIKRNSTTITRDVEYGRHANILGQYWY